MMFTIMVMMSTIVMANNSGDDFPISWWLPSWLWRFYGDSPYCGDYKIETFMRWNIVAAKSFFYDWGHHLQGEKKYKWKIIQAKRMEWKKDINSKKVAPCTKVGARDLRLVVGVALFLCNICRQYYAEKYFRLVFFLHNISSNTLQ